MRERQEQLFAQHGGARVVGQVQLARARCCKRDSIGWSASGEQQGTTGLQAVRSITVRLGQ